LNDILKQRLVGALVLIALGVVFWPVIFVQSERQPMDRSSQVPPMPKLRNMQIEAPEPVRDIAPAATEIILHDAPPEAEDSPLEDPAERPRLDDEGLPVAWVLQVISVSKKDKADQLTRELVDLGHKAYSRAIRRDEEVLYRVYIGPVFDRSGLLSTKRDIDERFTVNAIIARYVP
jgi:DedD protein